MSGVPPTSTAGATKASEKPPSRLGLSEVLEHPWNAPAIHTVNVTADHRELVFILGDMICGLSRRKPILRGEHRCSRNRNPYDVGVKQDRDGGVPEAADMRQCTSALLAKVAKLYPCLIISGRSRAG